MFANAASAQTTADPDLSALPLVSPLAVPTRGNFWYLTKTNEPPAPGFTLRLLGLDAPVYQLEPGNFLVDDRDINWAFLRDNVSITPMQPSGSESLLEPNDYGCGLWLEIALDGTNNRVLLTLHNTRSGQTYTISSLTNLNLTSWATETNLQASGDSVQTLIAMGSRSNLFFHASESRDYSVLAKFDGSGAADNPGQYAPDSMGAAGVDHFVQLINSTISVYTKSGTLVARTNIDTFFGVSTNGTNYPTGHAVDPRIFYDQRSNRWVACAVDVHSGTNQGSLYVILAVSNDQSPTNLISSWTRHLIPVGTHNGLQAMSHEPNGVYLDIIRTESNTNAGHTIVCIKKPEIYRQTLITNWLEIPCSDGLPLWRIQPALNFDDVPTNGCAWLLAKGPPDLGTNYQGGAILYRRLVWSGTNAQFADTNWVTVTNAGPSYRDYYDLDGTNGFAPPGYGSGVHAPQPMDEGSESIDLHLVGSALTSVPVIRNGTLWLSHCMGLTGTNGSYSGDQLGTNVDRSAVQWFKLAVDAGDASLSYNAHGRIFSRAATNAHWYYFPSLMVNCVGDVVTAFSGSSASSYIGAYYSWRLSSSAMPGLPLAIQTGVTNFPSDRWGDYSATALDPTDDWSFWTVQEYAGPVVGDPGLFLPRWKTTIARIRAGP